jgi:hypothetical protein
MALPFHDCDDIHDAAADAVRALNARLARRGLELAATDALREVIAGALQLAEVEGVEANQTPTPTQLADLLSQWEARARIPGQESTPALVLALLEALTAHGFDHERWRDDLAHLAYEDSRHSIESRALPWEVED